MLENYITPYFFALTECHLQGDFRFYENQIDAPPSSSPIHKLINDNNTAECPPLSKYPVDEWTLTAAFQDKEIAKRYLDIHYEYFVTRQDIADLKANGVTHLRVPLGHWILGDVADDEPFVSGVETEGAGDGGMNTTTTTTTTTTTSGWKFFKRLVQWCREEGMQVWPDLHTAPGSQNGFDNSGHLGKNSTCHGWDQQEQAQQHQSESESESESQKGSMDPHLPPNVQRTLRIIDQITSTIAQDELNDVITGFGVLNEPFSDCDTSILRQFYNIAFDMIRTNIGPSTNVYIGDMFDSGRWNDGFWADDIVHNGTLLDSHIYQSFEAHTRDLSPKQHIALVCQRDHIDVVDCCYDEGRLTKGIQRIFTEWSATFDQSVGDQVPALMEGIAENGIAEKWDRVLSKERRDFLRNFVEAQMVSYEAVEPGESRGWFYWNFKVEGGIFAEWDFLRGVREGWIPEFPDRTVASQDVFGSCLDILFQTSDDLSVVEEIPAPSEETLTMEGSPIDDDVVLSHGKNLRKNGNGVWIVKPSKAFDGEVILVAILAVIGAVVFVLKKGQKKRGYAVINDLDLDLDFSLTKGMQHVETSVESLSSQE